jgi:hypothetical protein
VGSGEVWSNLGDALHDARVIIDKTHCPFVSILGEAAIQRLLTMARAYGMESIGLRLDSG